VTEKLSPIHPGEVLQEEFLVPLGITQHKLAVLIHVPPRRINEIVHGKRAITADTALRLARFFGTSDQFWVTLQAASSSNWNGTRSAPNSPTSTRWVRHRPPKHRRPA
jgi:addiction module HigA family antidote